MTCRCEEVREVRGNEAKRYARDHLREVDVRAADWETVYECLDTRLRWLEDHPDGEHHGGGVVLPRRQSSELRQHVDG